MIDGAVGLFFCCSALDVSCEFFFLQVRRKIRRNATVIFPLNEVTGLVVIVNCKTTFSLCTREEYTVFTVTERRKKAVRFVDESERAGGNQNDCCVRRCCCSLSSL